MTMIIIAMITTIIAITSALWRGPASAPQLER